MPAGQHTKSRIWTCEKSKSSFYWIKLYSNDNHHNVRPRDVCKYLCKYLWMNENFKIYFSASFSLPLQFCSRINWQWKSSRFIWNSLIYYQSILNSQRPCPVFYNVSKLKDSVHFHLFSYNENPSLRLGKVVASSSLISPPQK